MSWPLGDLIFGAGWWLTGEGDTTPIREGAQHLQEEGAHGRYVWFPDVDEVNEGTRYTKGPDGMPAAATGWREGFQVRCWGSSLEEAQRLRNNMIAALHVADKAMGANLEFETSRWLRPDEKGWNESGVVYVLRASIATRCPVTYDGGLETTITVGATEKTGFLAKQIVSVGGPEEEQAISAEP